MDGAPQSTNTVGGSGLIEVPSCPGLARVNLVDVDGHTVLHWAALGGNAEVCQILMENGISPNVQV